MCLFASIFYHSTIVFKKLPLTPTTSGNAQQKNNAVRGHLPLNCFLFCWIISFVLNEYLLCLNTFCLLTCFVSYALP